MTVPERQPTISIRRATIDDCDKLIEMHLEFCAIDAHAANADVARSAFEPLLHDDSLGLVWIVLADDARERPEGYGVVTWGYSIEAGGLESIFDEVYVRRRGIGNGTRAMTLMLNEVRNRGVARIYLETERPNAGARRLYERLGFVEEDSVWMNLDFRQPRTPR